MTKTADGNLISPAARTVAAVVAALAGGWIGLSFGDLLGYGLAALVDRDPAEIKDTLIWGIIASAMTAAAGGVWLALAATRASRRVRAIALYGVGAAAAIGATMMAAAYDWPKASGHPVLRYELRLPAGAAKPAMDEIDLTIWSGRDGHGCSIETIRMAGDRPEITGSIVIGRDNAAPIMSLQLGRHAEERWRLPYGPDAPLETAFGPWQRIDFVASPRENTTPLPAGDYHIRYRVRRYL